MCVFETKCIYLRYPFIYLSLKCILRSWKVENMSTFVITHMMSSNNLILVGNIVFCYAFCSAE